MDNRVIAEVKNGEIYDDNLRKYEKEGVWALWAKTKEGKKVCLEVAQTVNIFKEIKNALFILTHKDDSRCSKCNETYSARTRYEFSAKFKVHKCKGCAYDKSKLRKKSRKRNPRYIDKYRDMVTQYCDFEFVKVNCSDEMKDKCKRFEIEEEYAIKNSALYWWG